jgi:hypothetical protein
VYPFAFVAAEEIKGGIMDACVRNSVIAGWERHVKALVDAQRFAGKGDAAHPRVYGPFYPPLENLAVRRSGYIVWHEQYYKATAHARQLALTSPNPCDKMSSVLIGIRFGESCHLSWE